MQGDMDRIGDQPTENDPENPARWRAMAALTREKAEPMAPDLKERMLEIADQYELLADQMELRRAKGRGSASLTLPSLGEGEKQKGCRL